MLDIDGSLQLCMAFGDDDSYRLNYLVEKLGISDPQIVQAALSSDQNFHKFVLKSIEVDGSATVWDAYAKELIYREELKSKITLFSHITKVLDAQAHELLPLERIMTVAAMVTQYDSENVSKRKLITLCKALA